MRCLVACNAPMNGGFLSGARDKTTKYWYPAGEGVGYDMMTNFRGATHWIARIGSKSVLTPTLSGFEILNQAA